MDERPTMRIGQVAAATGVGPDTLRHYERLRLLPRARRAPNGYRAYDPGVVRRVAVIRAGLAAGLSLAELGEIFRLRERGVAPCRRVRELVACKLVEVERRLQDLAATRDRMRALLATWDARLELTPPGTSAGLLERMGAETHRNPVHTPVPRRDGAARRR